MCQESKNERSHWNDVIPSYFMPEGNQEMPGNFLRLEINLDFTRYFRRVNFAKEVKTYLF